VNVDTNGPRHDPVVMAEAVTLEFLAKQLERVLTEQASLREDMHVLTSIVLRHDNTLTRMSEEIRDMLGQMRAMVTQHQRFDQRLRRLEEAGE
jgi:hypothetical protein